MSNRLLKVAEMAQTLNISVKHAYDIVKSLPESAIVRIGRIIRVRENELNAWIESGGDPDIGRGAA